MADDLPDAPWAQKEELTDAPWASREPADHGLSERQKLSPVGKALSPITSYPETYQRMNQEAWEQVSHGLGQIGQGPLETAKGVGNVALGSVGYVASPISAAYRSVVGQPIEDVTGIPREYTEFAAQLATPGIGIPKLPIKEPPRVVPVRPEPSGPLGVTLSEGQLTHDMPAVRRESAARTGQLGPQAERTAQEFAEQQAPQVEAARETVARGMDPAGGQVIAESPYEAAEIAGQTFRSEAARAKAGVKSAYDEAKALPGEIESQAVVGLGNRVKNILGAMDDVIVDDQLTPFASKMISSIDDTISKLRIPNKAELNTPDPTEIAGVSLRGVEQVRKKLSEFRRGAYGNNSTDGRAASAVMDAFDDAISNAINSGHFRGDPLAIKAWNNARAAHADYKTTFGKGKRDPVGAVIEKITGDRTNAPSSANALADYLYGASGVNPSDLNVGVATRMRKVLGADSPEWAAVRQGMFERLTSKGEGVADFGSTNIANRLNKFLNSDGKDLSAVMFTPEQRNLMQQYADLHRALEVPKGGYNLSETSTFLAPTIQKATNWIMGAIGGMIGHVVAPGFHGAGEAIGAMATAKGSAAVSNIRNARKIANQMPIIERQMREWRKEMTRSKGASTPALTARTLALSQSLSRVGIDGSYIRQLMGTVPSAADQKQGRGPRNNEPDQDADGKSHGGPVERAAGGAVNHNHNPTEAQKKAGSLSTPVKSTAARNSAVSQSTADDAFGGIKFFGDIPNAKALLIKGFDGLDRNRQHVVLSAVRTALNNHKIGDRVIEAIPVDVMDLLIGQEVATEKVLNDPSVLAHRLTVSRNIAVSKPVVRFIDSLASMFKLAFAGSGAEKSNLTTPSSKVASERNAAIRADENGRLIQKSLHGEKQFETHINPSEAQKKAGNYLKGTLSFQGLPISIENPKGSNRTGIGKDGKKWSVRMSADYGYIKRTEGADGDHVDVYLGPNEKSDQVFVVDQKDAETGRFDEHKVLLGMSSESEARKTYRAGFSDGKDRIKHMRRMSMAEFKDWLEKGNTSKPIKHLDSRSRALNIAYQSKRKRDEDFADGV